MTVQESLGLGSGRVSESLKNKVSVVIWNQRDIVKPTENIGRLISAGTHFLSSAFHPAAVERYRLSNFFMLERG
jgi:hypothetical protein